MLEGETRTFLTGKVRAFRFWKLHLLTHCRSLIICPKVLRLSSKSWFLVLEAQNTKFKISYSIPGRNGSLDPAEILANCVWYCNANEQELKKILTDSAGVTHTCSLGIGKSDPNVKQEQIKAAKAILPPPLAEVFQKVEHPFIQAVTDNLALKSAFMGGKLFLVGDTLAGLRTHTAAGTAQAAMNALLLKKVFENDRGMSIEEWEKATVDWAKFAQSVGVQMGDLSQFGDHPMADNGEPSK